MDITNIMSCVLESCNYCLMPAASGGSNARFQSEHDKFFFFVNVSRRLNLSPSSSHDDYCDKVFETPLTTIRRK